MQLSSLRRAFAATLVIVAGWLPGLLRAQTAAAAPPPVESFFQNPAFGDARISPTGRHVAISVTPAGGRTQLVVFDTTSRSAKVVATAKDADVNAFYWVNAERLVFNVRDSATAQSGTVQRGGLFAVQYDGSDFRQLVDRVQPYVRERGDQQSLQDWHTYFHSTSRQQDSDTVFVTRNRYTTLGEWDGSLILALNTRTGRAQTHPVPGNVSRWVVDQKDTPRVAVTVSGPRAAIQYLDPADGKWAVVQEFDQYKTGGIAPIGFAQDGSLYVVARGGADKDALFRLDLARKALDSAPVLQHDQFDFRGSLVHGKDGVIGIRYLTDARATAWLDPGAKDIQARVDKLLPGTINQLDLPVRPEVPVVLVRAWSDRNPGDFLLFDTQSGKLTPIGQSLRGVDPRQMARRDMVRYKARDGLEIPAWLTLPNGAKGKPVPMVVLVHGGPWVRGGEWRWEAESQFLASRGYAVLEPEFRGSAGYGLQHLQKGFRQWGLAMQNDLADGARWAAAGGIADPSRICIAGASYGGYATLMGLINDPDLFRCGVAWAAVSDIDLIYDPNWSDLSDTYRTYGMPVLVGHRQDDAARLKATSPVHQAERLTRPLLLAHGGADRRVPVRHGVAMRDALSKHNPDVQWVEYTDEGHGWALVRNRVDFWQRVEAFLGKQIGPR